jgi:hypothetical protein
MNVALSLVDALSIRESVDIMSNAVFIPLFMQIVVSAVENDLNGHTQWTFSP